jgi:hypothetical protein
MKQPEQRITQKKLTTDQTSAEKKRECRGHLPPRTENDTCISIIMRTIPLDRWIGGGGRWVTPRGHVPFYNAESQSKYFYLTMQEKHFWTSLCVISTMCTEWIHTWPCRSVCPHDSSREPLDGFGWNEMKYWDHLMYVCFWNVWVFLYCVYVCPCKVWMFL